MIKIIDEILYPSKITRFTFLLPIHQRKIRPDFQRQHHLLVNYALWGFTITVDQDDKQKTDAYGRMVAKITCSGKNLNAELLENGHAIILKQYCSKSEFASESWTKKFGC